ncbi:MAG: glycosyltransferase family 2 protein [Candidatus Margulisbacteria bacterium]|nr:glycosyltransferase family 2 protein [Candidatus Margulisiibacteriota bacterium]
MAKLSVIMPNYNYGQYIGEALEAVAGQSVAPEEIIVIDDASTDDSLRIIEQYRRKYPAIKLLRNEKNMGVVYSMRRGAEAAAGDYIYYAASDDKVRPGFIERSLELLEKYPQAAFSCCDNIVLDGDQEIPNRSFLSESPRYFSPREVPALYAGDPFTPYIPHTAVINRSFFNEAGGLRLEHKWSCDSFVFSVMAFRHGYCYRPEGLQVMRVHKKQYGASNARIFSQERDVIRSQLKTLELPQYKDVLPQFRQAAPFSVYPYEVLRVIITNPKYWDYFSLKLLRFALFDKLVRRALIRLLPMSFWRRVLRQVKLVKYHLMRRLKKDG